MSNVKIESSLASIEKTIADAIKGIIDKHGVLGLTHVETAARNAAGNLLGLSPTTTEVRDNTEPLAPTDQTAARRHDAGDKWNVWQRKQTSHNDYQGKKKRVLCVCSAGLLRSPTVAVILTGKPFYFNTRAAGLVASYALIPVDEVLLEWADEIVCMTRDQEKELKESWTHKVVHCLDIEDSYEYMQDELVEIATKKLIRLFKIRGYE